MRIYCPECEWEPSPSDRWVCGADGCGTVWNTFETLGKCPGCGRVWQFTQCLACARWSRHMDWYHVDPPTETERSEVGAPAETAAA